MKSIHDILSGIGITVPEDKKKDFETVFNENYKTVSEVGKITAARDNYKSQLETAQKALKEFDGVDVADLKGQITKLTGDLAKQSADYEAKISDRDFNDLVSKYAGEFKARDVKAVMPFLDAEKLRQSKNQNEDIKAAFEAVKKDNSYLFEDDSIPRVVSYTSGPDSTTNDNKTKANEALRSFFGKE